ncbi:MAG TPA: hypothetical protein VMW04_04445 [Patescibacteria group bacterium]|nr:hypothetical protein [Patescibacteria group bacterium]
MLRSLSSSGIQSKVDLGEHQGKLAIRKRCGFGLSLDELQTLLDAQLVYRQGLSKAGLIIPENLSSRVTGGEPYFLENIDCWIEGDNLDEIIKSPTSSPEKRAWAWNTIIETIIDIQDYAGSPCSRVLIDAKPANFIFSVKDNQAYYVDFFPPLLRGEDGLVSPYFEVVFKRSRELMTFNYGDTRGQITKLLALAKLEYSDYYNYLLGLTMEGIKGRIPSTLENYIISQARESFPHMSLFYSQPPEFTLTVIRALATT